MYLKSFLKVKINLIKIDRLHLNIHITFDALLKIELSSSLYNNLKNKLLQRKNAAHTLMRLQQYASDMM